MNKNDILSRLENWCTKKSNSISKIFYREYNSIITTYRYNSAGVPYPIQKFNSIKEVEVFLNRSEELEKFYNDYLTKVKKRMQE